MVSDSTGATLGDWGEFRLINEIILPILTPLNSTGARGDDCAFLPVAMSASEMLVVTTDVGPKPLSWNIGCRSYWSWGWYSVVVNLSDLASAGARVLAFTSSIDAPRSMLVNELQEFFTGVADACKEYDVLSAGGNIREANKFACHGTALGAVNRNFEVGRSRCQVGDIAVAIGESGQFMAAFLRARAVNPDEIKEEDKGRLLRPVPRLKEMRALAQQGLISAASDNSDGVLGSLWNIAERSCCAFKIEIMDKDIPEQVRRTAQEFDINPWNLMLCWGDWQMIATVRGDKFSAFRKFAVLENIPFTILGDAVAGDPMLFRCINGERRRLPILRNENFVASSFNDDIEAHLRYMLFSDLSTN